MTVSEKISDSIAKHGGTTTGWHEYRKDGKVTFVNIYRRYIKLPLINYQLVVSKKYYCEHNFIDCYAIDKESGWVAVQTQRGWTFYNVETEELLYKTFACVKPEISMLNGDKIATVKNSIDWEFFNLNKKGYVSLIENQTSKKANKEKQALHKIKKVEEVNNVELEDE